MPEEGAYSGYSTASSAPAPTAAPHASPTSITPLATSPEAGSIPAGSPPPAPPPPASSQPYPSSPTLAPEGSVPLSIRIGVPADRVDRAYSSVAWNDSGLDSRP